MRRTTTWIGTPNEKRFTWKRGVTVALKQVGIGRGPVSNLSLNDSGKIEELVRIQPFPK